MEKRTKHTRTGTIALGLAAKAIVDRLREVRTAAGEDHRRPQAGAKGGRIASKGEGEDRPQAPPALIRHQMLDDGYIALADFRVEVDRLCIKAIGDGLGKFEGPQQRKVKKTFVFFK
jgi:hypothetical protein